MEWECPNCKIILFLEGDDKSSKCPNCNTLLESFVTYVSNDDFPISDAIEGFTSTEDSDVDGLPPLTQLQEMPIFDEEGFENQLKKDAAKTTFSCYSCKKPVLYTAIYCPICGKEISVLRKEKEKLYNSMMLETEQLLEKCQFNEAEDKIKELIKELSHEHFSHMKDEAETKKERIKTEDRKAAEKKNIFEKKLYEARKALEKLDFDEALSISKEMLTDEAPYLILFVNDAKKIITEAVFVKQVVA